MIDEYQNAPYAVKYAKNVTEPIVINKLIDKGYTIIDSTRDDDFNGIDIIVNSKKNKKININLDVKCSENKNQNTDNFLFTTISNNGKKWNCKKTDYVVFINKPINNQAELIFLPFNKIKILLNDISTSFHKSKFKTGKGEYALINKNKVKDISYIIKLQKRGFLN